MPAKALLMAVLVSGAVRAATFDPARFYPVGGPSQAIAIADVTGDRHADVLLTDQSHLFVFRGSTGGALSKPVAYSTAGPSSLEWNDSVAVADVNRDGRLDAVVADRVGVQIYLQRGGRFAPPRTIALPFAAVSVAAGNIDGDGRPDLVVSGRVEQTSAPDLYLLQNRRAGWHTVKLDDRWYWSTQLVDVNSDGRLDVVALPPGNVVPPSERLYIGDGRGGFTPRDIQVGTAANESPVAIVAGDVTGDRRPDLVFVNGWNRPVSHLAVMAGQPSGGFAAATIYPALDASQAVAIADVNGDGRKDVVVAHGGKFRKLGIFYQSPNGALGPEQFVDVPTSSDFDPNGIAVGNLDAGHRLDVALANQAYENGVVVLQQR